MPKYIRKILKNIKGELTVIQQLQGTSNTLPTVMDDIPPGQKISRQ